MQHNAKESQTPTQEMMERRRVALSGNSEEAKAAAVKAVEDLRETFDAGKPVDPFDDDAMQWVKYDAHGEFLYCYIEKICPSPDDYDSDNTYEAMEEYWEEYRDECLVSD